jgi:hypothetical protein
MEQRPARGHQVVGVHRHPVGRRIVPCDRPEPDHLGGEVVGHQLRGQLPQQQRVQLGRVHRHRGMLGVGEQVGEQPCPAAPHPSLRPDRRGQLGGRPLDPLGTERAARSRLFRQLGELLLVGRGEQRAAGGRDQPGGVPGERVPAHLHAGRHGLEPPPRVQDLPSQDLAAQLHRTSRVSAADQDPPARRPPRHLLDGRALLQPLQRPGARQVVLHRRLRGAGGGPPGDRGGQGAGDLGGGFRCRRGRHASLVATVSILRERQP